MHITSSKSIFDVRVLVGKYAVGAELELQGGELLANLGLDNINTIEHPKAQKGIIVRHANATSGTYFNSAIRAQIVTLDGKGVSDILAAIDDNKKLLRADRIISHEDGKGNIRYMEEGTDNVIMRKTGKTDAANKSDDWSGGDEAA